MREFLCKLFTKGKHSWTHKHKHDRYYCRWCGIPRCEVVKPVQKPLQTAMVTPLEEKLPELAGEHGED